jgi:glycosyltransferase involved in cell wall biosynthesis
VKFKFDLMVFMKRKICFVVSSLVNEGPVRVMLNIIKYIDFDQFEVSIITLKGEGEKSLISEFEAFPIAFYRIHSKGALFSIPVLVMKLRQIVKNIAPDIIHTHCPRSIVFISLIKGNFRKFHTIHNFPGLVDRVLYGSVKGTIVEILMKWALKRLDRAISCSGNLQVQLQNKLNISSISINNGVDFETFSGNRDIKLKAKQRLGLNAKVKCFVFVGRFSNEKNPLFLLKAFRAEEFKDCQLLMLGDGPLLKTAKESASLNVNIVGFQENVRDYLIAADVFVSSSVTEGMPNSVLEAMSTGLPLLLSNIPAHREIIDSSPKRIGLLFDLNDEVAFKKAALILLKEWFNEERSRDVLDYFKFNYTAEQMSHRYQQEYIEN